MPGESDVHGAEHHPSLANPAVLVAALAKTGVKTEFSRWAAHKPSPPWPSMERATIPKCDKVFGPGNSWVAAAKMLVAQDSAGAAVDLPAGPTEVLVVADDSARADFVAADLLAQAEHSPDAQALLVTTSSALAEAVARAVKQQLTSLSRVRILAESVHAMRLLVVDTLAVALQIANCYAPEHLLLQVREPRTWLAQVTAAGAVFLGNWSPESTGDYCSGPNHTLPTYGHARSYSALALEDFQKRISVQELTPSGLRGLGPTAEVLARLEGLDAHAAAVTIRLAALASLGGGPRALSLSASVPPESPHAPPGGRARARTHTRGGYNIHTRKKCKMQK